MNLAAATTMLGYWALATLGVVRWGTLLTGAAALRLLAPVVVGAVLAAAIFRSRARPRVLVAATALALLVELPLAGIPVRWIVELRIAVICRLVIHGIGAIPGALVPVLGGERALSAVILLGAGWLTILGGLCLGLAARRGSTVLRATALVPLLVLVALPSVLIAPRRPYLEGIAVFLLLAVVLWSERLMRLGVVPMLALAAAAAGLLAPGVRAARPWVDLRDLAGGLGPAASERFDFTQGFGPLRWPRTGREVFDVRARGPEYWKVVDLDTFDGRGFAPASSSRLALPAADPRALARDTQTITVNIVALQSTAVIGAGSTQIIWRLPGNVEPALSPGGFTVDPPLSPGTSYDAVAVSPRPTGRTLARIAAVPALPALGPYLAMYQTAGAATDVIQFPEFHSGVTSGLAGTPYAPVYALAQRLAQAAPTPVALVRSVMDLLAHGFVYDEHPSPARYPLVSFLLATHRGYCQQFAGAMALLLRMAGVPARVVGGFTPGTFDSASGRWIVQDTDAHDWVEVWFPHVGWVTFDPTPAVDPALARSVPLPSPLAGVAAAPTRGRAASGLRHRDLSAASSAAASALPHQRARAGNTDVPWLVPAGATLVLALGAAVVACGRRRGRSEDPVAALVIELERALERCRRPAGGGVTLAALERRFAGRDGAARYVRALRQARYAGAVEGPRWADRRALRAALGEGLGFVGRLRSWWALPPRRPARGPSRTTRSGLH
ncbi:MAG TPA: transglutaminase family protein [Solirubrobacteraceae bacterium]|nr:transglutaminase family protein [Solirubrobacteraceae bacterium]